MRVLKQAGLLTCLVLALSIYFFVFKKQMGQNNTVGVDKTFTSFSIAPTKLFDLTSKLQSLFFQKKNLEQIPKHEIAILHLWASWCDSCVEEFPAFLRFAEAHPNLQIWIVSLDSAPEDATRFLSSWLRVKPAHVTYLVDSSEQLMQQFGTITLPSTYFINKDGLVFERLLGPQMWTDDYMQKQINRIRRFAGLRSQKKNKL